VIGIHHLSPRRCAHRRSLHAAMRRAAAVARQVVPQIVASDDAEDDLFQLADANGDGKLDRDEWKRLEEMKANASPVPQPQSSLPRKDLLDALYKTLPPRSNKFNFLMVKQAAKAAARGGVTLDEIQDVLNRSSVPSRRIVPIVREIEEDERFKAAEKAKWDEQQKIAKDAKREAKKERLEREAAEEQSRRLRVAAGAGVAVCAVAALVTGARKLHKTIQRILPRCFAKSNYKRIYDATKVPKFADEMHSATRNFLRSFARQHSVSEHAVDDFYERLFSSAVSAGGTEEMLNRAQRSSYAVRVWTSAETMEVHGREREFCSMLQQVIRGDGGEDEDLHARAALKHAAVLCRAINEVLCRGRANASSVTWPSGPSCADTDSRSTEANVTWRGGGLPSKHQWFYEKGKKFRTDMFVATSFHIDVAQEFWRRADEDPVEWKVCFGANKVCRHVNFISGVSEVEDEKEFLFPPYSVFTVKEVHWSDDLSAEPHRVVLQAAMDNANEPEDLPVAPWI